MSDLSGHKSGRLTVIRRNGSDGHSALWLCRCDCGTEKTIPTGHLLAKKDAVKSCGCLKISKQQKLYIKCKNCTIPQHRNNFYKKWKNHGDTRHNICKKCCRVVYNEAKKRCERKLRLIALIKYGGNPPKCACCDEKQIEFLTIDHTNGGGSKHRKSDKNHTRIGRWLKQNKYPPGFQVLCFNCNCAKGIYGICPHRC